MLTGDCFFVINLEPIISLIRLGLTEYQYVDKMHLN